MDPELKKRDKAQAAKLREAKKQWLKEIEAEPKVECIVRNHDFINQGVPIEFVYKRVKKYSIKDGEKVLLPLSVYQHINSRIVPDPVTIVDDATGQLKTDKTHTRARFSAVLTDEGMKSLTKLTSSPKAKEASQ